MSLREMDTGTADLQARLEAGVLTLALNRPEARNAMSAAMIAALSERLAQAAASALAKVEASVEREIGAATKAATFELKRHAAGLAMELAERKVRARLDPQSEDALVQGFVSDLDRRPRPAGSN